MMLLSAGSTVKSLGHSNGRDLFTSSQFSAPSLERYRPTPSGMNLRFLVRAVTIAKSVRSEWRDTRMTRRLLSAPNPWFLAVQLFPSSVDLNTPWLKTPAYSVRLPAGLFGSSTTDVHAAFGSPWLLGFHVSA